MKKIIHNNLLVRFVSGFGVFFTAMAFFFSSSLSASATIVPIVASLDIGSRGDQVTSLQEFLATSPSIYPEGMITGYYGSLTAAAVSRFQAVYGLPQVGRVGPLTRSQINTLISSGSFGVDVASPAILSVSPAVSNTSATLTISTDGAAQAKVFYAPSPLVETEGSATAPTPYISGGVAVGTSNANYQTVSLTGLMSNTTYYYVVMVTDVAGNISVTNQSTFHTN